MSNPPCCHLSPLITLFLIILMLISTKTIANPETLTAWHHWVLEKHPKLSCPANAPMMQHKYCIWPGQLSINLIPKGAQFDYHVTTYADSLIPLPGDSQTGARWPKNIILNGKPAILTEQKGKPYVQVPAGVFHIRGEFSWPQSPKQINIPKALALIELKENGKIKTLNRKGSTLYLNPAPLEKNRQTHRDTLTVEVYRKLNDNIPLFLDTELKLSISGTPREVLLGRLLPENNVATFLHSPLPARIEQQGLLRVQVRPGQYTIKLRSRYLTPQMSFNMQATTNSWPKMEYWSFAANHLLRTVEPQGAPAVDTQQIPIPQAWASLPTYKLTSTNSLQLQLKQRTDVTSPENILHVKRNLWLDFAGKGYTTLDYIHGKMYQNWRLSIEGKNTHIGRATVSGKPVLITKQNGQEGIEIRSPSIDLEAVTQQPTTQRLSAVGWQANAASLSATLHLPPGWRSLFIQGTDQTQGTWLTQWNLWDLFLCMVIVSVLTRLINWQNGLCAGVTLLLTYQEPYAPAAIWLILATCLALLRFFESEKVKTWIRLGSYLSVITLLMIIISFTLIQFRLAFYPQLEQATVKHYQPYTTPTTKPIPDKLAQSARLLSKSNDTTYDSAIHNKITTLQETTPETAPTKTQPTNLFEIGDTDLIQTGPGLPTWSWQTVQLDWSGPVSAKEQLRFFYLNPIQTLLLRLLGLFMVLLLAVLVLKNLIPQLKTPANKHSPPRQNTTNNLSCNILLTALTLPWLLLGNETTHAHDTSTHYPPEYLLKELETRLTKPPLCTPNCVAITQAHLAITKQSMTLTLHIDSLIQQAIALPAHANHWMPTQILLNDQTTTALRRSSKGFIQVSLEPGKHQVQLSGELKPKNVTLAFPMPVHNFTVTAPNWDIRGLIDGRIPSGSIELLPHKQNLHTQTKTLAGNNLLPDPIPSFVYVERTLELGTRWRLTTQIKRIAPHTGPINVNIPLWPQEQIITESIPTTNQEAHVQLRANQKHLQWTSELNPTATLSLTATRAERFIETWRIEPSSLWHIEYEGIPPVKASANDQQAGMLPSWKPWPGETLHVKLTRPKGVTGPTQTIEQAHLNYQPGKRIHIATLALSIRSSQGSEFSFTLPESAKPLVITLAGQTLNLPKTNEISVPLKPGLQKLEIKWQTEETLGTVNQTPSLTLPASIANIQLQYQLNHDRWPLYLLGPAIGPAMLYWGILCVILLGAATLAWLQRHYQINMPIGLWGWLLLGLGLSTVSSYGVIPIALWFFAMHQRLHQVDAHTLPHRRFNILQVTLILLTLLTLWVLLTAIPQGLLSTPNMKITGNQSTAYQYYWYQDRSANGTFPQATVISLPILVYQLTILIWSIWMASQAVKWITWGWQALTHQCFWRKSKNT